MYRPQDSNPGADQQFHLPSSSTSSFNSHTYNFSPFPASSLVGPSPQSSIAHLSPRFPRPVSSTGQHASHQRNASSDSHPGTIGPPSASTSPRLMGSNLPSSSNMPGQQSDRSLPNRQVTAETIPDAYVAFILYCNPVFPLSVDTTALRNNFQSPPKSDNKEFETFKLYQLIEKLESKEIKTWNALALDLGVEPPDVSKGQSVQKVQQYSVRLKRWMRAMHVDAFFEYLLGKEHSYYTDIPPASDPHPSSGRDGVLPEEDLAIRALDPTFRPKRGRRRNSENEGDEDTESTPAGRQPRLMDQFQQPNSAVPMSATMMSAQPNNYNDPWTVASAVTPQSFAPWAVRQADPQSAYTAGTPSTLRWQLQTDGEDPSTPSAHPTSMAAHIDNSFEEPKSAVGPAGRKRRKHGPAVSSAWPSMAGPGAKPRGRPPASRQVQDGPFSTFPANPSQVKPEAAIPTSAPAMEIQPSSEAQEPAQQTPVQPSISPFQSRPNEGPGRPGRLSLQVPPHTGPPVRLATPPRVLVNGESNTSAQTTSPPRIIEAPIQPPDPTSNRKIHSVGDYQILERDIPGFAFEVLKRVLASDLLRAELVGRKARLSGDEAKRLADTILGRLNIPRADNDKSSDDIARLTAASWLGLGEQLRVPLGPATGRNKKLTVTRFRVDAEGYEEIISASASGPGGDNNNENNSGEQHGDNTIGSVREVFDLSWNASIGGCNGAFEMKGLALATDPNAAGPRWEDTHDFIIRTWSENVEQKFGMSEHWASRAVQRADDHRSGDPLLRSHGGNGDGPGPTNNDGVDWRAKYMELQFGVSLAKGEFMRIRDRLVERVLDVLI